ncbi:MAG: hypothetical protein HRU72_00915 [Planctomycetia bacterium]|nr:hypothetical protein [Candidatus Brocadia sp.]QOJ05216.1 MAG: hypothetical protein HRU72_00915 [Planctomycetia bacterium]HQU31170.1 hypothetical protein [Candidatus Brocadia sapporoensis]
MIYRELLYSRSLSRDYRWMIIPPKVSLESLQALNRLYDSYDEHKHILSKSSLLPLYCLNYPETTFLVSCGLSNHKDKEGRDIYCLQGISVPREYRRHLWFVLPWILANYDSKNLLNVWRNLDFSGADAIVRRISGDCFFEIDQTDESFTEMEKGWNPPSEKLSTQESTYVSFNEDGLKELSHLIVSAYHDCIDFAFGVTPAMTKYFNFKIIAETDIRSKRSNIKNKIPEGIASATPPSPVGYDHEKTIAEPFDDPISRFDPGKKDKAHRMNLLRENSSARLLGQFLPRFLSLFKIRERLKRFNGSNQP